jgi:GNAT superfamily N-acetyltransferase
LHELYLVLDAEYYPGNPEVPWPQRLVDWRYFDSDHDIPRWIIWEGDRVVASGGCFLQRSQDLDNSFGFFYVLPEYRNTGLGRKLAAPVLEYASDRKRFAVAIPIGFSSAALAKRAGMKDAYRERVSQLRVADVDLEMLDMWVKRARERASDYEVLFFTSPIPEEFRKRFVAVTEVMNTAPMEDFEEDPFHWTDELLADAEAVEAKRSRTILTAVAVHEPTGVFAGYTNIVCQKLHPAMAYQWDTGVDPDHRNKGLGRWLKAAMMQDIVANYPDVEIVVTENAESNAPMLNINVEMGFKPYLEQILWQGELASVRAALSI